MMSFGPTATTRSVRVLLIATFAVFVMQLIPVIGDWVFSYGALVPVEAFSQLQVWRLVSYMFMHDPSSPFHILFNMLVLWMFGAEIENLWGSRRFTTFYLICGIGSGLFSIFSLFNSSMRFMPVIGASGAVLGVLTVYAYYFPARQVLLFFILPVNIRIVVLGYALISLFYSLQPGGVISHITHLGGIVVALAYVKVYPALSSLIEGFHQNSSERQVQQRVSHDAQRKKYFEEVVDPILDKIAKEGMDSLTSKEKQILRDAARTDKDRLKNKKILPFDLFR